LAQTFIIGGVGNDLYPRSWERMERTASLDDRATLCLGDYQTQKHSQILSLIFVRVCDLIRA